MNSQLFIFYDGQLLLIALALKRLLIVPHFVEQNPQASHIGLFRLQPGEKLLGRHVGQSSAANAGKLLVLLETRPSEIADLDVVVVGQQQVLRLDVPHEDSLGMDVLNSSHCLSEVLHYAGALQPLAANDLIKVSVLKNSHNDEDGLVLVEVVDHPDHVGVAHQLVAFDLILNVLVVHRAKVFQLDDLYRVFDPSFEVLGLDDPAECSPVDFFDYLELPDARELPLRLKRGGYAPIHYI